MLDGAGLLSAPNIIRVKICMEEDLKAWTYSTHGDLRIHSQFTSEVRKERLSLDLQLRWEYDCN